ncbi:Ger(x)C family spore germination protein [Paenibacillus spongiae]|uniref:Ger(X)C family spore germination protein n=1 Tax=Paenibacillus spongiae TaxID=2909671 RepID=A0ABY5S3W6_9BACL|nr:Ger(x)C family spore germination protein [Paenibacillus spongiae]UVI28586.1 Ger(x)C family spore germination protein [Paenibacillus spongiae]
MKHRFAALIGILACFVILTGCWSRKELNDLGIVLAIGIDKAGKQYEVSVQVVNPGEVAVKRGGTSGYSPVTLYSSKGNTIAEAIRRLTTVTPRKTYFSHIRILVLSESLARQGIGRTLDYLSRDHEFRSDFYIAIAREMAAKEILGYMSPLEKIPANKLFHSLEVAEKEWSPIIAVQLNELTEDLLRKGDNPVLTGIRVAGDKELGLRKENVESIIPGAVLQVRGLGVFKDDKLVGWLNETESKGYSDLTDKLHRTAVEMACPEGGKLAVDIVSSKTKLTGKVVGGEPEGRAVIRTEADVSDVECQIDLSKADTFADLEKRTAAILKRHSEAAVAKAQKLETDIFGFGEAVRRANPAFWRKAKLDWDSRFAKLPVRIEVDVKIRRIGTITNPLIKQLKE